MTNPPGASSPSCRFRHRNWMRQTEYPGMEEFGGQILHSSQHRKAMDHAGKKVVVGSCTPSHDICADYCDNGVDVTMIQRGPT